MPQHFKLTLPDGTLLRGTRYACPADAKALIVIAHGYKGFKDWGMFPYAAESLSRHFEVIAFNFTHNGIGDDPHEFTELEKFAFNTYSRELCDLSALIGNLREDASFKELPLFLLGHSRGGGVCLVHALDHPGTVAGVVSWNGVTDLDLFTPEQKSEMRSTGRSSVVNGRTGQAMPLDVSILKDMDENRERFDLMNRISAADFPIVLIQGTEDIDRLQKGSAVLVEVNPSIQWLRVQGGNHTFNTVHPFRETTPKLEEALRLSEAFILSVIERKMP
ncbi:alpha/beta hydrolase family protein [Paenibacillus sp. DMB20]|uniref:alpha/beta hydrolase family protein n=1 Tax=Paenibacillus sp. DMB20 TaxID=1642570 RepID=UPI0006275FD0|nr:alpha/beta fold hydrolase [Paenibacillus sp. DMB20]KKO50868.1 lysophospholipase [Paenibacillus sp. DMB20]